MKFRRSTVTSLLAFAALLMFCDVAPAQKLKLPFRKKQTSRSGAVEALRANHGPWLIMCASFSGESAEQDARRLAAELSKNDFRAYLHRKQFDYSGTFTGKGWQTHIRKGQEMSQKKMKAANDPVVNEVAVLVGDFASIDSARAQRELNRIKTLQPRALTGETTQETSQNLRQWRDYFKRISKNSEQKSKGPLGAAFLVANPLLPKDFFTSGGIDSFVLKMNKQVPKYSLLDCPKAYSVRVATFRGDSTFDLDKIKEKQQEQNWLKRNGRSVAESKLGIAMENAHILTKELRRRGLEAYEYHDRFESYVCVGSFDYISQGNQNNPEMVKVINTFKADVENLPNIPNAVRPKALNNLKDRRIVFDSQPVPVRVPRPSTHTAFGKSRFR